MIPCEQLERWRALANAATPGPWYAPDDGDHIVDGNGDYLMTDNNVLCPERADFNFTAAAREAVPALLTEVESQAKEIEHLRERERAARIEAVEEFRKRALAAVWDPPDGSVPLNYVIERRIAALPALPEEP